MTNVKVTNKFLWINLLLGLIIVVVIRFIFNDKKSPVRCIKKFPIHLPH